MSFVSSKQFLVLIFLFLNVSWQLHSQKILNAYCIGSEQVEYGYSITVDKDGNRIICGTFSGSNIDFAPGSAIQQLSSNGPSDIFLLKISAKGEFIWAFNIGGPSRDAALSVATDTSGNIYVTGYFRGKNVDFDPWAGTALLSSNGDEGTDPGSGGDVFIAKYDPGGHNLWARNIGGVKLYDCGRTMAVDMDGNVYLSGLFTGVVDFDPGPGVANLDWIKGRIFLAKYNSNGQYKWAFNLGQGGNTDNCIMDIKCGLSGNIYVTGFFGGTDIDFDPGPGTFLLSSKGKFDILLAKYSFDGRFQWVKSAGDEASDWGRALVLDSNENIYIIGDYKSNSIDFDPLTPGGIIKNNGAADIFVSKYDSSGKNLFAFGIGGASEEFGSSIAIDGRSFFISGGFSGNSVDFDPSGLISRLNNYGESDIFYAKYSLDGRLIDCFSIGGMADDYCHGLVSPGLNIISSTGYFQSKNVDFNPEEEIQLISSNGNYDIFIADYDWNQSNKKISVLANSDGSSTGKNNLLWLYIIPAALLISLVLFYRYRNKRKKIKPAIFTTVENEKPELSEIQIGKSGPLNSGLLKKEHYKEFSRLEKYLIRYIHKRNNEQYMVNVEEINNVLGLSDKSESVQKKNRSDIINDINQKWSIIHKTNDKVIISQRSEYDKRVFEYFIHPSFMLEVAIYLSEKE